jgi:hypothetical protein
MKIDIMAKGSLVKGEHNEMLIDLLKHATGKAAIEIRFEDAEADQWSVITLYDYKGDKELSLRLHLNDVYDIHLGYYDDQDDFIEIEEPLTIEQKTTLPEKLKKVMKKVLDDEEGLRVPAGTLLA